MRMQTVCSLWKKPMVNKNMHISCRMLFETMTVKRLHNYKVNYYNEFHCFSSDAHSHIQQISTSYTALRSYISLSCSSRSALYYLYSLYTSSSYDRRWRYGCRSVPTTSSTCISLSSNSLYGMLLAQCPTGYAMTRIYSSRMTSTSQRDRYFSIRCCRFTSLTNTCQFSPYINSWRGTMSYSTRSSYVMTGIYSHYFPSYA